MNGLYEVSQRWRQITPGKSRGLKMQSSAGKKRAAAHCGERGEKGKSTVVKSPLMKKAGFEVFKTKTSVGSHHLTK